MHIYIYIYIHIVERPGARASLSGATRALAPTFFPRSPRAQICLRGFCQRGFSGLVIIT